MDKPSLKEIAAMPFPASERAMRQHYDPTWNKHRREGEHRPFRVEIGFSIRETESRIYTVSAVDHDHAQKLADEMLDDDETIPDSADEFETLNIKEVNP